MMEKIVRINDFKDGKMGRVTPRSLTENLLSNIDNADVMIYMIIEKDSDEIRFGWSEYNMPKLIGLVELLKADMMKAMEEIS
jgi:hypothetical protein